MKRRRGMVLMITLATITLLIVILQQIAFDSRIEFENGASKYHSLRAYHSAKSGIELALFKILIYRKVIDFLDKKSENPQISMMIKPYYKYVHWIWNQPLIWPIKISSDFSEIKKSELQEKNSESLLQASYQTTIEPEVSKFNLMDIVHPRKNIRDWAKAIFYNLMVNIREKSRWFQDNYSIDDIREITNKVEKTLNPFIWNTNINTDSITQIDDLKHIDENTNPEWVDWIRPYITLYSEGGFNIQWAHPLLLQSLHESISYEQAQELQKQKIEEDIYISDFKLMKEFFAQNQMELATFTYEEGESPLKDLVLNFESPQIFKITSVGKSTNTTRKIEVIFYDSERIFKRTYQMMNHLKEKTKYKAPDPQLEPTRYRNNAIKRDSPIDIRTSPFIIHWK